MSLTTQILSPRAPCLLQRALRISGLSNGSIPILQPQSTFPPLFEYSNFLRMIKLFAQFPSCPSKLRNSNFYTNFSLFFPLLVSSSHTLLAPD